MTPLALFAPIQVIVDVLEPILVFFHDKVGVGWGTSIVLLTICVRAVLTPLMVKQFKSMKAMAAFAPRIKAVQEKYKGDKERQQQEVMKLYQANGINPFASCLPLVAQLPFFIGLFYLLQGPLRSEICGQTKVPCGQVEGMMNGAEKFLFIPDLTAKASGWVLVTLVVMYISSQLVSSLLTPSTGDRNQKLIIYGLPFVFTPFIISFPAGLIVYWITTNLWTVGQGYILRRRLGPIMPKADEDGDAPAVHDDFDPDAVPKKRGLMARLAEAADKQAAAKGEPAAAAAKSSGGNAKASAATKSNARTKSGGGTKTSAATKSSAGTKSSGGTNGKAGGSAAAKPSRTGPPPPPPRKKKKRSGRRR